MTEISERAIERILEHEPDEAKAQEAIDRFLKIKQELQEYLKEHYKGE